MDALQRPLAAPADWLRPSSFIIALGVSLGAAFASLSGAAADGHVSKLEWGLSILAAGSWFGWTLAGVWALPILFGVLDFVSRVVVGWFPPPAPEAVAETVADTDDEPDPDAEQRARLDAMLTFFHAGEKAGGFSAGLLSPGVVGSDTWEHLTDFYVSDAGGRVLRVVAGNVGTVWNHGHGLDSTIRGLRAGKIPLPPGSVPTVSAYVAPVAAQRSAPRRSATKKPAAEAEVVDIPRWPAPQ